ncbi:MAG: hypothetical protein ABIR46_00010 [Candidatus Saccharimonadales bacterium]
MEQTVAKTNKSLDKILKETDGLYNIYVPAVAIALESVNAAIMLCYLVHWDGRGWKRNNLIYKSMEQMLAGTGLTRDQQDSAIAVLKKHGFIDVERMGNHGVRHFSVNMEKVGTHLAPLWKSSKRYNPSKTKSSKRVSSNPTMTFVGNQQSYTEETHNQTYRKDSNLIINPSSPGRHLDSLQMLPNGTEDTPPSVEGKNDYKSYTDV